MSYIGMIIHSSTLDTMEKVIAFYGGTTWEKIEGVFLLGASDTYAAGSTGGEATHTLTVNEMPSHTHSVTGCTANSGSTIATNLGSWTHAISTSATGGSQPHNNMPPYKSVYIWERIA